MLLLDDATLHSDVQLYNVKLKLFPANTTSFLQPLDQGIILALKQKYRKTQLQYMITQMERSKEKYCSQLLKKINVIKVIYWIKQVWNDIKCNTIVKCFKRHGFLDNTAKNLAEELFGATVDELGEIDANNEESDDDDDVNKIDFNLVAKKVVNHLIDELIKAESLVKTGKPTHVILLKLLEKRKKQNQKKKGRILSMIIQQTL